MVESCPRCGATLQPIEDAPPAFCGNCGLPQLRISEDALTAAAAASTPRERIADSVLTVSWPSALRTIAVGALLGTVPPMLLPGALTGGEVSGLALLIMPALTLGVVGAYYRRRLRRPISAALGARVGAVLGLVMGAVIAFATGVAGFILRYGYRSRLMDEHIQQATDQMLKQVSAAGPLPPELVGFFRSPEFHAGTFLLGHFLALMLLVVVGTLCGALAGGMLRARRQRHMG